MALREKELPALDNLEARGRANRVDGLRRVSAAEIADIEPGAQGLAALHSPHTGIVDYKQVCRAIEDDLRRSGVEFRLGTRVDALARHASSTTLVTNHEPLTARFVVGCAGLWADRLAVAAGAPKDPRTVPFRGGYLKLRPGREPVVRGLVYPVPDPELPFLGVHITKMINGDVLLGPTAMLVLARDGYKLVRIKARDGWETLAWPGTWSMGKKFWRTGFTEVHMAVSRKHFLETAGEYVPSVVPLGLMPGSSSGVRAQALGRDGKLIDDFVISPTPGAIHVRNAPSPAATSALALAKELVNRFETTSEWEWHQA